MKKSYFFLVVILLLNSEILPAQDLTQVVRGRVIDKDSKVTLPGANVVLYKDSVMIKGGVSDVEGNFRIDRVPVGRYTVIVSFLGYESHRLSDVSVNSAKELILNVELEESVTTMEEVSITAREKFEAVNEMATLSARTFDVEETERYAGSRGDPARMASNYAGVQGTDDSSNDIVVRGNSPMGILWRFEGVNIPNPNHFGVPGYTGGPVTILNNKFLANSEFISGAFPAEYGNAIAAVFDLKMKNGNNEKHEFSGQWGFLGTEIFGEGPISRAKRSSYLLAYRYSTLAIMQAMGIDLGTDAVPKYQDAAFKLNFPLKGSGNISFFGIGGMSSIEIIKSTITDPADVDVYGNAFSNADEDYKTGMGVAGLNLLKPLDKKTYVRLILASSIEQQSNHVQRFSNHLENNLLVLDSLYDKLNYKFIQGKQMISLMLNRKISGRNTFKAGIYLDLYNFNFNDSIFREDSIEWDVRLNTNTNTYLLQPFLHWKYRFNEKLTFNLGINFQFLGLNESQSFEPRMGFKWVIDRKNSLSAAYGLHSQMLPAYQYFAMHPVKAVSGNISSIVYEKINMNTDFIRSQHYVLSYENFMKPSLRIRVETYYQYLTNLPVEVKESSYSILNEGLDMNRFFPDSLQNTGKGENYGIEITMENYFSKTYFFLASFSLFDSRYTASNGNTYNTSFNGNYIFNMLGTREFNWGKKSRTSLGIGGKITIAGGKRYTPFDVTASEAAGDGVVIDTLRNSKQFRDYFRADLKINYKVNALKVTHEIGLDLVNIFNTKNIFKITFVGGNQIERKDYQLGFLPIFYYKIDL